MLAKNNEEILSHSFLVVTVKKSIGLKFQVYEDNKSITVR